MLLMALVFCLATTALGQTPGLGRCPNVEVIESYNSSEFQGVWYMNKRSIPNIHELHERCTTANFSRIDNDTTKVIFRRISTLTGEEIVSIGAGQVDTNNCENSTNCGKLIFEFPIGIAGHDQDQYWILDTDYTSYSVVWSCNNYIFTHLKYLWILTREEKPSESTLDLAFNVILKNRIDNIPLKPIDHSNCS